MILGPITIVDCFVFILLLFPQQLLHNSLFDLITCGLRILPFLFIKLPISIINDRYLLGRFTTKPFAHRATLFEDAVVRCVHYGFTKIKPPIARVFFVKGVSWPFLRYRMLKHGYLFLPVHLENIEQGSVKGVWMVYEPFQKPDVVLYFAHGGGFSMGSSYFYLEFFLITLVLLRSNFSNPAIFALDYSLAPESSFPSQVEQALAGYNYLLNKRNVSPSRICVAGDSAGGTIMLSLLLRLARPSVDGQVTRELNGDAKTDSVTWKRPGMACLISPWATLVSSSHRDTESDYLDAFRLHVFAHGYVGRKGSVYDPVASPGSCKDVDWWLEAAPLKGFAISYGSEEVLAQDIRDLVELLRGAGVKVVADEDEGGVHAWPVAGLFLGSTKESRIRGVRRMVDRIAGVMKDA
ncbi:hypothetical protein V495_08576 [Pseudogymnoascus sp. VKM F-4514 (FW-929)]|nr:hypothetical protein V495_08576 [Pseudogymnoascus sp. VKM F-4514 (FW-929)]KFY62745.1 hypothetical protein V497_02247 [Pseudogymnoascus sp. VKM F-4516 (FW-969)]